MMSREKVDYMAMVVEQAALAIGEGYSYNGMTVNHAWLTDKSTGFFGGYLGEKYKLKKISPDGDKRIFLLEDAYGNTMVKVRGSDEGRKLEIFKSGSFDLICRLKKQHLDGYVPDFYKYLKRRCDKDE